MASIQERQELAETLRQIGQDNAYVYQAQAFKRHLEQLPDVAAFSPEQVMLNPTTEALTTLQDCTALVRLPGTGGRTQTLDDWHDLLDAYFHDERQPAEPLPHTEAAFDLATELIERDAVTKAVRRNHEERTHLLEEVPRVEAEHDARMASHRREVTRKLSELRDRKDSLYEDLRAARDKVARHGRLRRIFAANGPGYAMGCLSLALLFGVAFHFTRNLTLSLCLVGLLTYGVERLTAPKSGDIQNRDRLQSQMHSLEVEEAVLKSNDTPAWYDESMRQVEDARKRLEVASTTEDALARYAWPLDANEQAALTRLTADIAQDASSWRAYTIAVVDASVEVANARIMANEERVSLMPSSVGKAFELARVVEEGYADNTKEALLYLATESYRNSNLALQAAQLNQLELTRMENAEYMRALMVRLAGMSLQLQGIERGIDTVNSNLGEISGQLSGIQGSLDDIEDAAWATASAAQATAANTAQIAESARNIDSNTAATARNTAATAAATTATAYHARRAADATQDLRDFYAADHPSASPNGSRMRRLGPGERYASGM